ncbi:MAG: SCO family protein [Actinobacteria bacterium]|nr:SCO family protein [Actinomycetota bacterium]MCL5444741.1 SCO family protein [Actinomycetota bacterium]
MNRKIPTMPLISETGLKTSLAAFRGKYVVLAPFLTLCQEMCPITTGAFIALRHDVNAAGLGNKVVFVEISVDPWRDSPARLRAYSRRFGATWPLLTGTLPELQRFWKYFGVYFQKVPEPQPPGTDWWTGKKLTFDIDHSDGFILISPNGNERFLTASAPNLHCHLAPNLKGLLDSTGINNLCHPAADTWTVPEALNSISWLVGQHIPPQAAKT